MCSFYAAMPSSHFMYSVHATMPSRHTIHFIFLWSAHNALQALERPYEGPFRVITASSKVFTIERGGKLEIISIDRLKPAHLDFHTQ